MIKVSITKKDNKIEKIIMTGHANYADYGKDIVCASASSIVITSVNAIMKINEKAITLNNHDNLEIIINVHDNITDNLVNNMIDLLLELQEQYKKNIIIKI